jgi:hypothetical protein
VHFEPYTQLGISLNQSLTSFLPYFAMHGMVNVSWRGNRYDFFPEVLDPSSRCIDKWIKTTDEEAYEMVRTVM